MVSSSKESYYNYNFIYVKPIRRNHNSTQTNRGSRLTNQQIAAGITKALSLHSIVQAGNRSKD